MNFERAIEQQPPTRRRWRIWTSQEPVLAGLGYEQIRTELRHGPQKRQDELLAALVRVTRHDTEAVMVVVACLLPGLRGLIARHAPGLDRQEALAEAIGGLCEAVARFDGEPVFVASRLLRLPRQRLQRAVRAQDAWRRCHRQATDHDESAVQPELSAAACLRLAVDAGVLTDADAWLIHATRIAGHSLDHAARQLDISYEAVKKRRQRAEARWVAWWECPAEDDDGRPDGPAPNRAGPSRPAAGTPGAGRSPGGAATPNRRRRVPDTGEAA